MDMGLSPQQRELTDLPYQLATERLAPRASVSDREASFPFDDYPNLHASGLLALCVPEEYGGLGAEFETYCFVAEQIARGNAATALTYDMHYLTMLMMGPQIRRLGLSPEVLQRHQELSAKRYREVVESGVFYGQPLSEPVEAGQADDLPVGGRRFGARAEQVDGSYLMNGRKLFVSLEEAPRNTTPLRPCWWEKATGRIGHSACPYPGIPRRSRLPATGTLWECAIQ